MNSLKVPKLFQQHAMGSHQWRGSSLLALLQAHKDLRPAPALSLRCKWPWPGSRYMTSLPSGLLQIIPHFWKDSYSEMFSVTSPPLLIHAAHKNRTLSTFVWRYSLSIQALKTLHGPCLGAKYCLSPASPNGQTGIQKLRIWPNVCFKWVNTKTKKALKSPEELMF